MSRLTAFTRASARLLGTAFLAVAFVSLFGGATCIWTNDDDDSRCFDDDAGNDAGCDDDSFLSVGDDYDPGSEIERELDALPAGAVPATVSAPGPWLLGGDVAALAASLDPSAYRLGDVRSEAGSDPRAHPQARLVIPDGPSLTDLWQLAVWSPVDLTAFAEQIRAHNADRLELPPAFGELRHTGTHVLDTIVAVVYGQFPTGGLEPWPGARQVLVFDQQGRLLQVENELIVPPGRPIPPPEAWAPR